jgi:hypothetical protein
MPRDITKEDSVDVGYDDRFERKWWTVQRISFYVLLVFVIAGLLGVFGRGPLSMNSASSDGISIEYDRFARYRTSSVLKVSIDRGYVQDGRVSLFVSQDLVDTFTMSQTTPLPESAMLAGDGVVFAFDATGADSPMQVKFSQQPPKPGIISGRIGVPTANALNIRQIVYP